MGLTIACWKWRGWRDVYTAQHVNTLAAMLAKHMSIPYRLVCITDDPEGIACETFPLWTSPRAEIPGQEQREITPDCFLRLRMFDPRVGRWFGDRVLSIDLDCVVLRDLAPLLTGDSFKAAGGAHSPICGTLWQLQIGRHADVWHDYDPVETPLLISQTQYGGRVISGSDQAWMSIKMPQAPTWGYKDGVHWARQLVPDAVPDGARLVYFAGKMKPWDEDCRTVHPQLFEAYRQCAA